MSDNYYPIEDFINSIQKSKQKYIAFANSYVRDTVVAEDIFMESVFSLWENRSSWRADSNFNALLLQIIKNKSLNYLAKEKKRYVVESDINSYHLRELNLRISTLEVCDPERIFQEEIQEIAERTIRAMPKQSREIFAMSRDAYMSNREIAESLGISIKSVEAHITRALKILRQSLKDYLMSIFF